MQFRRNIFAASLALSLGACVDQIDQSDDEYSVAESQVVNAACGSATWCVESVPTSALLHGVWAASADDVFAVGDAGTILRRQGNEWTAMASPATANLRTVYGTSSSNVWAVGGGGVAYHFNGSAWSAVAVATTAINAVWLSSPSDVWMAGTGKVFHSIDGGATFAASSHTGTLYAITGTSASDVWAAGENSYLRHYVNGTWSTVNPGAGTSTSFTILAVPGDVWVTDFMTTKETMHQVKGKWTAAKATGAMFQGLYAPDSKDIWGVGGTKVGRWNGTAWTLTSPFGGAASLWGVTGGAGHVFAVGSNGLIAHYAY